MFTQVSLGVAALAYAMPWRDCVAVGRTSSKRALVLVDSTLPASRAYAAIAMEAGGRRLEVGTDVGALWHDHLCDWTGTIRGVLRPSDCFVLRNLSMSEGRMFRSVPMGRRGDADLERAVASRHAPWGRAMAFVQIT